MKSRKEIYIQAHKKLVEIYEQGKWTGKPSNCPLCQKFFRLRKSDFYYCSYYRCEECSLYFKGLNCSSMKTYNTPIRLQFHEKAIEILKNLPNKRFHKRVVREKGFPELWKLDKKLGRKI
jgi:hypothetical protein